MTKQENEMDYEVSASDLVEIKCEQCDIAFRTPQELEEHNETEHRPAPSGRNAKRRIARESTKEPEEPITV